MSLHLAARRGDITGIEEALIIGEEINGQDENGQTALICAAQERKDRVLGMLLRQQGIDVNSKDNSGRTALSWAVETGGKKVVRPLLDKGGIDANSKDNNGQTALMYAAQQGNGGVLGMLLREESIEVNSKDNNGCTALSWAVKGGRLEMVRLLLTKNSIDANSTDENGLTALLWAVQGENKKVVEMLLSEERIDVKSKDNNGMTALMYAAQKGNGEVLGMLLREERIKVNSKDNNGCTALSWAVKRGRLEIVRLLLKKNGIDANSTDENGQTALLWAVQEGNEKMLALLLIENAIDVNLKDNNGWTALSWAVIRGRDEIVRLLLKKKGIDTNSKDNNGRTALSWAAENGDEEIVRQLLDKKGIDTNSKDGNSQTALLWAIEKGHIAMVNLFTKRDSTSLHIAIQRKNHRVIELLLNASVDTKGIMAESWRHAYGRQPGDILLLAEGEGQRKSVRCIEEGGIRDGLAQWRAKNGTRRSLFLVLDLSPWENELFPGLERLLTVKQGQLRYFQKPTNDGICICFCVAVCFPPRHIKDRNHDNMLAWNKRSIAWTVIPRKYLSDEQSKSIDHLSTLPNGWIPDDGDDFFKQFIICLKERWVVECDLVEGDLAKRRRDQLFLQGKSPHLIRNLAKDAQMLASYHTYLQDQVATAREFAKESGRYGEVDALKDLQSVIDGFAHDINHRVKQLDQTVRDLLQFEFAWVSINEAHRSTDIATSMKRLSWITFVFLPAMFASSIFGMNVDLLKDNPDWRWCVLFGGAILTITFAIWLIFKFNPNIELWIERKVGEILQKGRKRTQRDAESG